MSVEIVKQAGKSYQVRIVCSDRSDGDFRTIQRLTSDGDYTSAAKHELLKRRQKLLAGEWTWLDQAHTAEVVTVTIPGENAGTSADAAVTAEEGAVLAIMTADCVPIVLVGEGCMGVVHAGWRGMTAGIVANAVDKINDKFNTKFSDLATSQSLKAVIGPLIRASDYEFSPDTLETVANMLGVDVDEISGKTKDAQIALDLAAAIKILLERSGISDITDLGFNTADQRFYSHRARGDKARQVTAALLEPLHPDS